ncbi:MAG: hypothetical protein JNK05_05710 [Myxococcales bacterium]|nr:hypothetical protein [Myxococcales bacterium]
MTNTTSTPTVVGDAVARSPSPKSGFRALRLGAVLSAVWLAACGAPVSIAPDASDVVESQDATDVIAPRDAPPAADVAAASNGFRFVSSAPETCPSTDVDCASWPPSTAGTVTRMTSQETRDGRTRTRTFHVYVPSRVTGRVPLVVMLHGGAPSTSNAALEQLARSYDELADGRAVSWRRNTANCQLSLGSPPLYAQRFEDRAGQPCVAPMVSVTSSQPYILVLPDGVKDDPSDPASTNGQHWEDGRVPSPGQIGDAEHRDDVGFIDHVLEVLLLRPDVDPERVGLIGVSNGGMMAQRIACHAADPRTPRLGRIAAFSVQIAAMPEAIHRGLSGRELCPTRGDRAVSIAFFVANGVDTPQCARYGCSSPTINGDSRMPYGVAGGTYSVNSPDSGRVIAADDSHRRWVDYAVASGAGAPTLATTMEGVFTSVRTTTFAASPARVVVFETRGGVHGAQYSRNDFNSVARPVEFVLSYRINAAGVLRYEPAAGSFTGTW